MEPQVDARDNCLARWSACPLDYIRVRAKVIALTMGLY